MTEIYFNSDPQGYEIHDNLKERFKADSYVSNEDKIMFCPSLKAYLPTIDSNDMGHKACTIRATYRSSNNNRN